MSEGGAGRSVVHQCELEFGFGGGFAVDEAAALGGAN